LSIIDAEGGEKMNLMEDNVEELTEEEWFLINNAKEINEAYTQFILRNVGRHYKTMEAMLDKIVFEIPCLRELYHASWPFWYSTHCKTMEMFNQAMKQRRLYAV
jgi:hypothetical protein